ncbi:MAG: carboxylating nicotinate-nucleotide diphosphorylase [Leptospirales bacterium]
MNNNPTLRAYIEPVTVLKKEDYTQLIDLALCEDRIDQDVTSLAIFSNEEITRANLIARQDGIIAGIEVFTEVFRRVDETLTIDLNVKDGDQLCKNDVVAVIHGPVCSILAAERTSLNFLSMISGIANTARKCKKIASEMNIIPLDTRKTLPGYRALSKYAVQIGGGANHRKDLQQMGLIKDNHIAAAGSISKAIQLFRKKYPQKKLEVEVDAFEQLVEALPEKPEMILLDNMKPEQLTKCAAYIKQFNLDNSLEITCEASGGYHPDNIQVLKNTGVDFVSSGALTNNITPFDFSLDVLPLSNS